MFENTFVNCTSLTNISFPSLTAIGGITDVDNMFLLYKRLFEEIIKNNPEKTEEYNILLKMNNNNYKLTVLSIETNS